jgi:LuxR family maltose regulon positive regulatory protein
MTGLGARPTTATLIRTKLFRPRTTDGLVPLLRARQTLDYQLDRPLTLVCAPAGFGKTTLLSDWLAHCPRPAAWLSLDAQDNDPALFLTYLVAAIRTIFPAACAATLALLQALELPPPDVLSTALNNDIDLLADDPALADGQRFVLVLDDYHLIGSLTIHQVLDDLLLHPPRPLHLAIGTRHDPPFGLAKLRARGQVAEVRVAALRFSAEETAAFLRQAVRFPLEDQTIAAVGKRAEGWAAALQFAAVALNMRGGATDGAIDGAIDAAAETLLDNQLLTEYLLNEVLAQLPPSTQDFLLRTAILNRLYGPLCDALTGQEKAAGSGRQHLQWLARENVFTLALDEQGAWYRYHHLLQKLLREQLARTSSPGEVAALHRRAAAWYAEHGYVEDAIGHALAAGDEAAAAELVETHRHGLMNREQWQVLERWLQMLPQRLIEARAELSLAEAWLHQSRWRIEDTQARLDHVDVLLQREPRPQPRQTYLRGEIDTLRSHVAFHLFDLPGQLAYAEDGLLHTPLAFSSVRGHAWMDYAVSLYLLGDPGWRKAVHAALAEDRLHENAFPTRILQAHCFLAWMDGDLRSLQQSAAYLSKLACERELPLGTAWGHYFLGCAAYQANDLPGARQEFAAVVSRRYLAHGFTYLQASFGLATVLLAQGEAKEAQSVVDAVLAYAWERGDKSIMDEVNAFGAYMALRVGRRAEARRWAAENERQARLIPLIMFHATPITLAHILVAQHTPASLAEAASLLKRLYKFTAETYNIRFQIEVLALQALLHAAEDEEAKALAAAEAALRLAEPGGIVRVFVDLGVPMAALLVQLAARAPDEATRRAAARVLAAFPHAPQTPAGNGEPIVTPLSRRELEVLRLLAERLTVKEVAERLVISELTAKRHTANIYQKLGVNRRRDALAAAQAAGLLDRR